jgi:hypothetical protein
MDLITRLERCMRIATLVTIPLLVLGAQIALPARAPAQVSVRIGARLGPEISLSTYSPDRYGDWRTNYRRWRPVTLYDVNGHYYQHSVRGARAVQVYRRGNEHFLPPQDQAWVGHDRRYNYKHQPNNDDYGRVRPRN